MKTQPLYYYVWRDQMRHCNIFFLGILFLSCAQEQRVSQEIVPLDVTYKDGIYKATYDSFDANNWKAFIEVQIRGGVIVSASFDDINPSGEYKTQNQWYSQTMKQNAGLSPLEAANELADRLVVRNGADVDGIAGATITSKRFFELAKAALEKASVGDLETAVLPLDETYTVEGDRDAEGYLPRLVLTFENGKITKVVFDQIHLNGESKRNAEGERVDLTWKETVDGLESALLQSQDPNALSAPPGQELVADLFRGLIKRVLLQRRGA